MRIHADTAAASAARAVQARAYTFGRDIVFGFGEYAPTTAEGKKLIAHELTHVLQQDEASSLTSSASGLLQRQPDPQVHSAPPSGATLNVSSEKWSTYAEQAYRRAGLVKRKRLYNGVSWNWPTQLIERIAPASANHLRQIAWHRP